MITMSADLFILIRRVDFAVILKLEFAIGIFLTVWSFGPSGASLERDT